MKAPVFILKYLPYVYDETKQYKLLDPPIIVFNFFKFEKDNMENIIKKDKQTMLILFHAFVFMNKDVSVKKIIVFIKQNYLYDMTAKEVDYSYSKLYLNHNALKYLKLKYVIYNPKIKIDFKSKNSISNNYKFTLKERIREVLVIKTIKFLEKLDDFTIISESRIFKYMYEDLDITETKELDNLKYKDSKNTIVNHIKRNHLILLEKVNLGRLFVNERHTKLFIDYLKFKKHLSSRKLMKRYSIGKTIALLFNNYI